MRDSNWVPQSLEKVKLVRHKLLELGKELTLGSKTKETPKSKNPIGWEQRFWTRGVCTCLGRFGILVFYVSSSIMDEGVRLGEKYPIYG